MRNYRTNQLFITRTLKLWREILEQGLLIGLMKCQIKRSGKSQNLRLKPKPKAPTCQQKLLKKFRPPKSPARVRINFWNFVSHESTNDNLGAKSTIRRSDTGKKKKKRRRRKKSALETEEKLEMDEFGLMSEAHEGFNSATPINRFYVSEEPTGVLDDGRCKECLMDCGKTRSHSPEKPMDFRFDFIERKLQQIKNQKYFSFIFKDDQIVESIEDPEVVNNPQEPIKIEEKVR